MGHDQCGDARRHDRRQGGIPPDPTPGILSPTHYVLRTFTGYVVSALRAMEGDSSDPGRAAPTLDRVSDASSLAMLRDVCDFVVSVWPEVGPAATVACYIPEQLGSDLWLARNGYPAFWYSSLEGREGSLVGAAMALGSSDLYLGTDGLWEVS